MYRSLPFRLGVMFLAVAMPAVADRSRDFQSGVILVPSSGGRIELPTLGYSSATVTLRHTGFSYRIAARTSDFNEAYLKIQRDDLCIDAPQSEVMTFNASLELSAVPAITIGNYPTRPKWWRYLLVDGRRSIVIAYAETKKITQGREREYASFPSLNQRWHIDKDRRYVFVFYNSASPAYSCRDPRE